jgi:hypothetical protein
VGYFSNAIFTATPLTEAGKVTGLLVAYGEITIQAVLERIGYEYDHSAQD